jgi:hypothetical protein
MTYPYYDFCFTTDGYKGEKDFNNTYLGANRTLPVNGTVKLTAMFTTNGALEAFMTWWETNTNNGVETFITKINYFGKIQTYGIQQSSAFSEINLGGGSHKVSFDATILFDPSTVDNDVPIAEDKEIYIELNSGDSFIQLSGYDIDNDNLTYEIEQPTAFGVLSGTPPAMIYTPDTDFVGQDCFSYHVSDYFGTSEPAVVRINVGILELPEHKVEYVVSGPLRVTGNFYYDLGDGEWKRGYGGYLTPLVVPGVDQLKIRIASYDHKIDPRDQVVQECRIIQWSTVRTDYKYYLKDQENCTYLGYYGGDGAGDVLPAKIVTRDSIAYYFDGGYLKQADIDEARYQDGVLLIEGEATNYFDSEPVPTVGDPVLDQLIGTEFPLPPTKQTNTTGGTGPSFSELVYAFSGEAGDRFYWMIMTKKGDVGGDNITITMRVDAGQVTHHTFNFIDEEASGDDYQYTLLSGGCVLMYGEIVAEAAYTSVGMRIRECGLNFPRNVGDNNYFCAPAITKTSNSTPLGLGQTRSADILVWQPVSRSTEATYRDNNLLKYADIDEARYQDGVLLIEGEATNYVRHNDNLMHADWDILGDPTSSIETGRTNPDGTDGVFRLTNTAPIYDLFGISQANVSPEVGNVDTPSVYARASQGNMILRLGYNSSASDMPLGTEWRRYKITALQPDATFVVAAIGDTNTWIEIFLPQYETGDEMTSVIVNGTDSPMFRAADVPNEAPNPVVWDGREVNWESAFEGTSFETMPYFYQCNGVNFKRTFANSKVDMINLNAMVNAKTTKEMFEGGTATKIMGAYAPQTKYCDRMFANMPNLTCIGRVDARQAVSRSDMFLNTPLLVHPTSSEQDDIEAGVLAFNQTENCGVVATEITQTSTPTCNVGSIGGTCVSTGEYTVSYSSSVGSVSFVWSSSNGTIVSGQGTDTITASMDSGAPVTPLQLTCVVTDDVSSSSVSTCFSHDRTTSFLMLDLPKSYEQINLRDFIDANNPLSKTDVLITNNVVNCSITSGDLSGLNVTLIVNKALQGFAKKRSNDNESKNSGLVVTSQMRLLNNHYIRGAGGYGGKGGKGADDTYAVETWTPYYTPPTGGWCAPQTGVFWMSIPGYNTQGGWGGEYRVINSSPTFNSTYNWNGDILRRGEYVGKFGCQAIGSVYKIEKKGVAQAPRIGGEGGLGGSGLGYNSVAGTQEEEGYPSVPEGGNSGGKGGVGGNWGAKGGTGENDGEEGYMPAPAIVGVAYLTTDSSVGNVSGAVV